MNDEIILGLDPGTAITGFGILKNRKPHLILLDYGAIRPPTASLKSEKHSILFDSVSALIERHKVTAVAVETQYVKKNVQSGITLGMTRGVIMLAATLRKIGVFVYAPSQAKRAVVGNGRASKVQVQSMIAKLLTLPHLPKEDAADALALAICHAHAALHVRKQF